MTIEIRPIHFLSYSSTTTLHSCPKEFQLNKEGENSASEQNVTFAFGHALGAGVQELLCGSTLDRAIWEAFLFWDIDLYQEEEKKKKSFPWVINALKKFQPFAVQLLKKYEVAEFNGQPAKELSAKIVDIPGGFSYRLHIDIVMRDKETGQCLVVELKHTGSNFVLESTYGNSEQALSYSVVMDKISEGNNSYSVLYVIYKTVAEDYEFFEFPKTNLDKAKWIKGLVLDAKHAGDYIAENFFPQRGNNCTKFNRTCKYYGLCGMSDTAMLASEDELKERVEIELAREYTFTFTLQEIIEQQLS